MPSCRICLEALKKPVSLPCGHIFCSDCIVKTVQAVKPYTHLHPCPICRSFYNIAPLNFNIVPPNLRPFVTPSIRRLYIDDPPSQQASTDAKDTSENPDIKESSPSDVKEPSPPVVKEPPAMSASALELARLRAENQALRNNCSMWRKRAEMHGTANLGLLNFARMVRDQASMLVRERDELKRHCHALKRKMQDVELSQYPELAPIGPFLQLTTDAREHQSRSGSPDPDSVLFAPHPIQVFDEHPEVMPAQQFTSHHQPEAFSGSSSSTDADISRPRKRMKPDTPSPSLDEMALSEVGDVLSRIAALTSTASRPS
ncbi:E3 ubiquitin-protein ligase RNF114 [Psilocybe cubensis]|uniref:RING-type domain-containing protein n=2 Tax=Psilocybe cubensis TaxID=181762 RepID=A0A8H8CI00_PSICU|nr:E3 ubiquitin-protein ligase RNF114 [Psilocybe cubensis]KAH9479178.1 E3 ubiquitin-protein ligase RNF114 [Psilocybe cubensis]